MVGVLMAVGAFVCYGLAFLVIAVFLAIVVLFSWVAIDIAVISMKQAWRDRHPTYKHQLHGGTPCYHDRYEDIFLCERVESENQKFLGGDPLGIYGNYPPASLS